MDAGALAALFAIAVALLWAVVTVAAYWWQERRIARVRARVERIRRRRNDLHPLVALLEDAHPDRVVIDVADRAPTGKRVERLWRRFEEEARPRLETFADTIDDPAVQDSVRRVLNLAEQALVAVTECAADLVAVSSDEGIGAYERARVAHADAADAVAELETTVGAR